jgi:hypothetical protein
MKRGWRADKKLYILLQFPFSVMPWNLTSRQCTADESQRMHKGLEHKNTKRGDMTSLDELVHATEEQNSTDIPVTYHS